MSLRVGDVELTVWKEFSVNSHSLTPTDASHFVVGDEFLTDEILDLLVPAAPLASCCSMARRR